MITSILTQRYNRLFFVWELVFAFEKKNARDISIISYVFFSCFIYCKVTSLHSTCNRNMGLTLLLILIFLYHHAFFILRVFRLKTVVAVRVVSQEILNLKNTCKPTLVYVYYSNFIMVTIEFPYVRTTQTKSLYEHILLC